jgi:hypothetical protein
MTYEQAVEKPSEDVTPAKAGVQNLLKELDSCFRRNDNKRSKPTFSTACEDVTPSLFFLYPYPPPSKGKDKKVRSDRKR